MHTLLLLVLSMVATSAALEDWEAVEEHLSKRVMLDTPETNMVEALKWLDQLRKPTLKVLSRLTCKKNKMQGTVEALRKIEKLQIMVNDLLCSSDDYDLRRSLLASVQACNSCSRLQIMTEDYTKKHAEYCQPVHMSRCNDYYPNVSQGTAHNALAYIEPFFDRLIYGQVMSANGALGYEHDRYLEWAERPEILEQIYRQFIERSPGFYDHAAFSSTVESLDYLVRTRENPVAQLASLVEEVKGQTSMSFDQLEPIFQAYITDQCIKLGRSFNSQFSMANQDIEYLTSRTFNRGGRDVANYYLAWAYQRTCWQIANRQSYRNYIVWKVRSAVIRNTVRA